MNFETLGVFLINPVPAEVYIYMYVYIYSRNPSLGFCVLRFLLHISLQISERSFINLDVYIRTISPFLFHDDASSAIS